jgi:hypothetical protein
MVNAPRASFGGLISFITRRFPNVFLKLWPVFSKVVPEPGKSPPITVSEKSGELA